MEGRLRFAAAMVGTLIVATTGLTAASAEAVEGNWIGAARMHGTPKYPDASGRGAIVLYPRHAEIDLDRLGGLPGKRALVLWLATDRKRAYIGGAFPRSAAPHGLSTIVPGRKNVSRGNARAADRLVLTAMKRDRLEEIALTERDAGWDRRIEIQGERVMRGLVHP